MIKKFFSIEKTYTFEISDITTIITILNVAFVIMGAQWAPLLGLVNCIIFFVLNFKNRAHINAWLTQIMLVVLNIYFLTL